MEQSQSIAKSGNYVNGQNFRSAGTTNGQTVIFRFHIFFVAQKTLYLSLSLAAAELSSFT